MKRDIRESSSRWIRIGSGIGSGMAVGHGDRSSGRLRLAGLAVLGLVSQEIEDLSLIP